MDMVVNGISIMALVVGLVEAAKKLGITGPYSTALALALGTAFGVAFYVHQAGGWPADFAGWFEAIVTGLAVGLASTGLYDVGRRFSRGE